jgi:hypothetical protein
VKAEVPVSVWEEYEAEWAEDSDRRIKKMAQLRGTL